MLSELLGGRFASGAIAVHRNDRLVKTTALMGTPTALVSSLQYQL
jgi:hypothetical protein